MAKPHVSEDFSLFRHHFRSGMTQNRMCGYRYIFVLQRLCIPFWPCTILCYFSHHSCGKIKHGGTQNSFLLFMSSTHTECLLILIFLLTLIILKPVTGGREIKMRAHGQADLRFCSLSLIWNLQFDKLAFIQENYKNKRQKIELPTCTISVRISFVAFWMALLWVDN